MYWVLLCFLFVSINAQGKVDSSDDGSSGTISFTTPDLNDEESHSPFMPYELKCDACRVISYQLYTKFSDFNQKHKHYKFKVPESEILDLTEEVCTKPTTFEGYGLKGVKKVNRLSGPGLETVDIPGVMQGGGKWPARLMDMCEQYLGEIGEDVIYEAYRKDPKSQSKFDKFLCNGKGFLGNCNKKKKKDEL